MALRWPVKDPDETLDYSVDWSRFLGSGITISAVTWYVKTPDQAKVDLEAGETLTTASGGAVTDRIQNVSQTNTDTVATINLGGGVVNTEYIFYCSITDTSGSVAERSVKIAVREK